MDSPDPVADAEAYQQHLLSLAGSEDPAAVQASTLGAFRELFAEAGNDLRTRPEPTEWSVLECFAHVVDAELVYATRYRWTLAHDAPDLIGYDQDLWVDNLHNPVEDPEILIALFEPVREANLALWQRTPVDLRDRVGMHRERGPESYGLSFTLIAGHDRFHLQQAQRALARIRDGGGGNV